MSSLAKRQARLIRSAGEEDEVFVLGESQRDMSPQGALATVAEVIAHAEARAAAIVAEGERRAAELVCAAEAEAGAVRGAAYAEGLERGRAEAAAAVAEYVELARRAAQDGKTIRDAVAAEAAAVVARATSLAVRRIAGELYAVEPEATAAVCGEALRAAAGQEVLSIRVHPGVVERVQVELVDAAQWVRPDDGIEIGGCVIDLRNGTIDASLETRLGLMELALRRAAGEAA